VPRFSTFCVVCLASLAMFFAGIGGVSGGESRPGETLLPDTTQGFFAISNVDVLNEHWEKTQWGHLMADPVMKPFTKDIRRQFEERWSSVHERLGLTLEDIRNVPSGDVAIGLISPEPGRAALAIVADVAEKLPQARELLEKVSKTQLERGAKRSEVKLPETGDVVVQFDLPELEEEKEAGRSTLDGSQSPPAKEGSAAPAEPPAPPPTRQAFYCLAGNLLAVTDHLKVMEGILVRAKGTRAGCLADHKPFQIVHDRCRKDYGEGVPQMRWFIHPLGYAEAARAATPESKRRKGKSILEVMRNQGIGAVQGVGGFADFASEDYELVHRTAVYAPGPYENSMKMAVLPNAEEFAPQPWAPRDIATYTTFYFDVLNAFDNFGPLFDELFGQGERGVWEDTLKSLELDPSGPQVNLRKELFEHFGQRISILTDYKLPITTSSERLLIAIEVNDVQSVGVAMEKLLKNDPTAQPRDEKGNKLDKKDPTLHKRALDGKLIWEIVEEDEELALPNPVPSFGDEPAVTPVRPPRLRRHIADDEEEEEERERLLPHAAATVWQRHLMIASHIDFLLKGVAPEKKPDLLGEDVDFLLVEEEIEKLDPKKCLRFFSRTDEEYRPTYELIRQNKMPESESLFARLLNALFGEGKKGPRAQKIDGSQLPEYQVVRRYLGPAGLQATTEPDGWFLKGFTLSKEAE